MNEPNDRPLTRVRPRPLTLFIALLLARVGVARGSAADTLGLLPKGVATAGALVADADDAEAAFYNPAGLGLAAAKGQTVIQIGYTAAVPGLTVDRTKAASLDSHPSRLPETQGFWTLGAVFPFGGVLQDKAALGLALYHPSGKLVRASSYDPRQPQWVRYGSGTDRMVFVAGLGAKAGPVSFGAGVNLIADLAGTMDFDFGLFERRVNRRDMDLSIATKASLVAGANFDAHPRLRLSAAYRQKSQLDIALPATLDMGDIGQMQMEVRSTAHFMPHELSFGARFAVTQSWSLSAGLQYSMWSEAPYPGTWLKVKTAGEIPEGLGLDEAMSFESKDPEAGYTDVWTPSFSSEYAFADAGVRVRAGYAYRPSFVPDQTGTGNYLDNSAHLLGLGASVSFTDPTGLFTQPLHLDLGAQLQAMTGREVQKHQKNDPVGDYSFGGTVFSAAAALRYGF